VFSNLSDRETNKTCSRTENESRDFVYIDDVIDATPHASIPEFMAYFAKCSSGVRTSVLEVANAIVSYFKANVPVRSLGLTVSRYPSQRGDLRRIMHSLVSRLVEFIDGLNQFLAWAEQYDVTNTLERSLTELKTVVCWVRQVDGTATTTERLAC